MPRRRARMVPSLTVPLNIDTAHTWLCGRDAGMAYVTMFMFCSPAASTVASE
eukprot:CAMPEP_0179895546 /NCGR_PEP_ID=MMETSP0982-20121206/35884_1 /TAXON_ID=483367 /ORGANISM="non described non described, Strain CCMP 2436" /LENGTH=51 /DNA_ID=CAMNT_0021792225 /DNA_START=344 /DNA_END=499 /DNA_ORIENTATION=+